MLYTMYCNILIMYMHMYMHMYMYLLLSFPPQVDLQHVMAVLFITPHACCCLAIEVPDGTLGGAGWELGA